MHNVEKDMTDSREWEIERSGRKSVRREKLSEGERERKQERQKDRM